RCAPAAFRSRCRRLTPRLPRTSPNLQGTTAGFLRSRRPPCEGMSTMHLLKRLRRPRARLAAGAAALALAAFGVAAPAASANTASVQHIGVPAYFNPNGSPGSGYWTQLDQSGSAVGIAIANPNNGPGT